MKFKRRWLFALGVYSLSCPCVSFSLPKDPSVVSGEAVFTQTSRGSMEISSSDHAIIEYTTFDIGSNETVRFHQSSSSSKVLNRVKSARPSDIFGRLESNGSVFLVNQSGMYFSETSQVNVGSFIASTLDISNDNFASENYQFTLGTPGGKIINDGLLESSLGSVALLSSSIENRGTIEAKVGQVALLSAEQITLDFTGDGLLQFSIEGALKDSIIEQVGVLRGSTVEMKIPTATRALSELVNTDGIREADVFVEHNGIIKMQSASQIDATSISVEASTLEVSGNLQAINPEGVGGLLHLMGQSVFLEKALLDVSAENGGGEVLIGGGFQGRGPYPWAQKVSMDQGSLIQASAKETGDGGLVVLWSLDHTQFNGTIVADGGEKSGHGGQVETSCINNLHVETGFVQAKAPHGLFGSWLLDPAYLSIVDPNGQFGPDISKYPCSQDGCVYSSDTSSTSSCTDCTIADCNGSEIICYIGNTTIESALCDVSLNGFDWILPSTNINMQNEGVSLTFTNCSGEDFDLCEEGIATPAVSWAQGTFNITTKGGKVSIPQMPLILEGDFTIDTTDGGSYPEGADITLYSVCRQVYYTPEGEGAVTLNAGTQGTINVSLQVSQNDNSSGDPYYGSIPSLKVLGAQQVISDNLVTNGTSSSDGLSIAAPLLLTKASGSSAACAGDSTVISVAGDAPISLGSVNIDSGQGTVALTITSESGNISLGAIGASNPPSSCTINSTSGGSLSLSGITTVGPITVDLPFNLNSDAVMNSGGGDISFGGTITGDYAITFEAGSGNVSLSGDVNVGSFTLSSGQTFNPPNITTTEMGFISISPNVELIQDVTLATGSGGLTVFGSIDGPYSLTASAPGGGSVQFSAAVGASEPLSSVSVSSADAISLTSLNATNAVTLSAPVTLTGDATIGSSGGDVSFSGPINASSSTSLETLSLSAGGTLSLPQGVGSTNPLGGLSVTSGSSLSLGGNLITQGSMNIEVPISITSNVNIDSGGSSLTLSSLTASDSKFYLTSSSGSSDYSVVDIGSESNPLAFATITGGNVTISGGVYLEGAGLLTVDNSGTLTLTSSGSEVNLDGDFSQTGTGSTSLGQSVSADTISFSGPVTVTSDVTLSSNAGIVFSDTVDGEGDTNSLTLSAPGSVVFEKAVGSSSPIGGFTVTGAESLTLADVTTQGNITIAPPVSLSQNLTLSSGGGSITLSSDVSGAFTLTLNAGAGAVNVQNLGGAATSTYLDTITLTGGDITLGGTVATSTSDGSLNITNSGTLSLLNGPVSLSGSFNQTGSGTTLLSQNITASKSLSFQGPITLQNSVTLTGVNDLTLSGTITPQSPFNLTLNATTGSVTTGALGSNENPLGALSISALGSYTLLSIVTAGQEISLTVPVLVSGDSTISTTASGTSGADIFFGSSLNAVEGASPSLTLETGSFAVLFVGSIGTTSPLEDLSATASSITLPSSTQVSGSVSLSGPALVANGTTISAGGDITLETLDTSSTSTIDQSITITSGGSLTFQNLGLQSVTGSLGLNEISLSAASLTQSGAARAQGAIDYSASGDTPGQISGNITSTSGSLTLSGPYAIGNSATLSAETSLDLGSATLNASDSGNTLTLSLATGPLTLGSIGQSLEFSTLSASGETLSLNGSISSGNVSLTGPITLLNSITVAASSGDLSLAGSMESDANGSKNVTLEALSGTLTLSNGSYGKVEPLGALTLSASSINSAIASIYTDSGAVTVTGPTSLNSSIVIDSTNQGTSQGANLSLPTLTSQDSSYSVSLIAGSGSISTQTKGSSSAPLASVSLSGGVVDVLSDIYVKDSGVVKITNSGTLTLGNGSSLTLTGTLEQNGAGVVFPQDVSFEGASFTGPSTIQNSLTLAASGDLSFSGSLDAAAETESSLILSSGGSLALSQPVGSSSPLGGFTVSAADDLTLSSVTVAGPISITPPLRLSQDLTLSSSGGNITLSADVSGTYAFTLNAGTGAVNVQNLGGTSNSTYLDTITLTGGDITLGGTVATSTSDGSLNITNSGTLSILSGAVSLSGSLSQTGSGVTLLSQNITAAKDLTFQGPITLQDSLTLTGVNDVTLEGALSAESAYDLTLTSTSGSITTGALGSNENPLGQVSISALNSYTLSDIVTQRKSISVSSEALIDSSSTLDTTAGGAEAIGATISLSKAVNTKDGSSAASLTLLAGASEIILDGEVGVGAALSTFSATGSSILAAGSIVTEDSIDLTGAVLLSEALTLQAGGSITASSFDTNASAGSAQSLTLSAEQDVTFDRIGQNNVAGSLPLNNLTITAESIYQRGDVSASGAIEYVATSANTAEIEGNITSTGSSITISGSVELPTDGTLTLSAGSSLDTSEASINGRSSLVLVSSGGTLSLGEIGQTETLSSLSATGVLVSIYEDLKAKSLSLSSQSTTVFEDITLEATTSDLSLSGSFNSSSSTSPSALTLKAESGSIVLSGNYGQTSALGSVSFIGEADLSSSIYTSTGAISFSQDVILEAPAVLDTTAQGSRSGADITFSGLVNSGSSGPTSLEMNLGSEGSLLLSKSIGLESRLSSLLVLAAKSAMTKDILVSDTLSINAPLTLSQDSSILSSSGSGGVFLSDVEASIVGTQDLSVEGSSGKVTLGLIGATTPFRDFKLLSASQASASSITASRAIDIDAPLVLVDSATLSTLGAGSEGGSIGILSVDGDSLGTRSLTLLAGQGTVSLEGAIGKSAPLSNLSVTGAKIELISDLVATDGIQEYSGPFEVFIPSAIRSRESIIFDSSLQPALGSPSLLFYPGGGSLSVAGSLGDAPFDTVAIFNAGVVNLSDVSATNFVISGGLANVTLSGEISLSSGGIFLIDAGPLSLGGKVNTSGSWIRTVGDIANLGEPQGINIDGNVSSRFKFTSINANFGNIGSDSSPIELNSESKPIVGAQDRADFTGEPAYTSVFLNPLNPPCIVVFDGVTLVNCQVGPEPLTPRDVFLTQIPKNLFYITWVYSSWDNLSNPEFFEPLALNLAFNSNEQSLYYQEAIWYQSSPSIEESLFRLREKVPMEQTQIAPVSIPLLDLKEDISLPVY